MTTAQHSGDQTQLDVRDDPARQRRAMLGLGLGSTLEWYDWNVFGLLAATIGFHFFQTADPVQATLSVLAIFAVGFVARPLGGVLLGGIADKLGRRSIMLFSITVMVITTFLIGVIPDVKTIGVWAPVLLLACRLIQGLSTGVEAALATTYAVEVMPAGKAGSAAGIISFFVNFGILLASLLNFVLGLLLGSAVMNDWGWRIPFWVGAALGLFVLWLRRALPETLHETDPEYVGDTKLIWKQVFGRWRSLLAAILVIGAAQAFNYAWNVGIPQLARSAYKEDFTAVFGITTVLSLFMTIGSLVVGRYSDKWKLSRTFTIGRILMIPTVFLMLLYTAKNLGVFAAVLFAGAPFLLVNMTLYVVVSTSLFPRGIRSAGSGLAYGIGVALFGGTASYLVVWLNSIKMSALFPVYLAVLAALSVVCYLWARKKEGTFFGE